MIIDARDLAAVERDMVARALEVEQLPSEPDDPNTEVQAAAAKGIAAPPPPAASPSLPEQARAQADPARDARLVARAYSELCRLLDDRTASVVRRVLAAAALEALR